VKTLPAVDIVCKLLSVKLQTSANLHFEHLAQDQLRFAEHITYLGSEN